MAGISDDLAPCGSRETAMWIVLEAGAAACAWGAAEAFARSTTRCGVARESA